MIIPNIGFLSSPELIINQILAMGRSRYADKFSPSINAHDLFQGDGVANGHLILIAGKAVPYDGYMRIS